MPPVAWTALGGPGEVTGARATADTIAVFTAGGYLYLRRRAGDTWRWERVGLPPTGEGVLDAALLALDGTDVLTPVVVGDDLKVWLYREGAAPTPWTGLAGPAPDVGEPFDADCGDLVTGTRGSGAALRHTLVMSSMAGRPWTRQGVDQDGTWFRIAADEDWVAVELATALASVTPGSEPQLHIFAVVRDRQTSASAVRVAVHENSVWTWIDPGGQSPNGQHGGLTATSFRDAAGRLQACAVLATGEPAAASMVIGSGRDWRWAELGQPPSPSGLGTAVVAAKGPDPQPGDEPVIVARSSHNIWTRSLTGPWRDLGTTPDDAAVVVPSNAIELAAPRRVRTAGVSWESDLWTLESGDAGVRWESHGSPGAVVSVVGAYTAAPEPDLTDLPVEVPVIDEYGAVWSCRVWGNPADGFFPSSGFWAAHGQPRAGVTAASGVGVFTQPGIPQPAWVFVVGSDGRLWAKTAGAWVDHGAPPGRSIKSGVAPIAVAGLPAVHVFADDGRLWMRSMSGGDWRWTDRGAPPGQLIFAVMGAAALPMPVAVVATEDGHLWVNVPDGGAFRWTDLGTPAPAERIVAAIGVEAVGTALDIVVVGSPSGQVWSLRWTPGAASPWTAHGRPLDARIRAAVGTVPGPAGSLAAVVGNDQQIWVTSSVGGPWSRWDPQFPGITAATGKTALLMGVLPCVVTVNNERRVHVATPEHGV
ncbi:hypothetical protein Acor_24700 [Acrocarpospora corrugata]|uniref:Uncharacterized protein n=1 Tax=Acrocarpospora corrugata TaxID=35763 RepID=A0A5M3VV09_9ACTN|nr:hypothetical protein [Acrocarpospora corrugata]GES00406.1 hypothetical protein Acor_24700 [Acrocarpospora corrugata]